MDSLQQTIESHYPHIYTVSVCHAGEVVFEFARPGYKHKVRTVRSVTKSIISTLYGIAIQQGYLNSLDEPVLPYFPEYRSGKVDANAGKITIRHLLTMTSGLDCSDRQPKGYFRSKNWVRFYLERPVKYEPGTRFQYSSAGSHVLSALLYKLTSLNVHDFARRHLFMPLGITRSQWSHDQQGYYHGGFGLDLSSASLSKIGQLYLDGGAINGNQIMSPAFLSEATQKQVSGGFPESDGYGYHWWTGSAHNLNYYYAAGLGGQYIFTVPELNLLTVITSESRRPHLENKKVFTDLILPRYIA